MDKAALMHIATVGKPHGIKGAMSIISKTIPADIVFKVSLYQQHNDEYIPFPISSYEVHHQKIICHQDTIINRNMSEASVGKKLYCIRPDFLPNTPNKYITTSAKIINS